MKLEGSKEVGEIIRSVLSLSDKPYYDPPFESPLEDAFAWNILKYLDPSIHFHKQFTVKTICGTFRIDFVADDCEKKIGFECDGREYHDGWRDEWRDAMILGTGEVDVIYRFPGFSLTHHLEDCLYLASRYDPGIFSERGLINLESLASKDARSQEINYRTIINVYYRHSPDTQHEAIRNPSYMSFERRQRKIPAGKREFWQRLYHFAIKQGGGDLDRLMKAYDKRNRI